MAGAEGDHIKKILNTPEASGLFLGDNGNRPNFWPRPALFDFAETKGIRVLPGSDPLPFPSACCRVGSFGISIQETIASENPAMDLKRILLDPKISFRAYGYLERPYRFLRNQFTAWIMKHRHKQKWMPARNW